MSIHKVEGQLTEITLYNENEK